MPPFLGRRVIERPEPSGDRAHQQRKAPLAHRGERNPRLLGKIAFTSSNVEPAGTQSLHPVRLVLWLYGFRHHDAPRL
jgi:hypothetical protein